MDELLFLVLLCICSASITKQEFFHSYSIVLHHMRLDWHPIYSVCLRHSLVSLAPVQTHLRSFLLRYRMGLFQIVFSHKEAIRASLLLWKTTFLSSCYISHRVSKSSQCSFVNWALERLGCPHLLAKVFPTLHQLTYTAVCWCTQLFTLTGLTRAPCFVYQRLWSCRCVRASAGHAVLTRSAGLNP